MTTKIDPTQIIFDEQSSAPATPATGKTTIYVKTDGNVYQKTDAGVETQLGGGGGGMTSFTVSGDSGTPQTITDGNTLNIAGGTGLSSVASGTDVLTVNLDTPVTVANGGTGLTTAPSNGQLLIGNGTGYTLATLTDGTGISITEGAGTITITNTAGAQSFAILQDQRSSGTAGTSAVSGAWTTRVLQTEVTDPDSIVTLASNQFTPVSGTYTLIASASQGSQNMRTRLRNATAGSTVVQGQQGQQSGNLFARFTANGTDAYEIQYYTGTTAAMGTALTSGDVEVYLTILLVKTA